MTRRAHLAAAISLMLAVLAGCTSPSAPTDPGPVGPPTSRPNVVDPDGTTSTTPPDTTVPPVTVPPTTSTVPPTPPTPVPSGQDSSGSVIPDTDYPIPSGAVFVAPNGVDTNAGTIQAPVRNIRRAISMTPDGGTVVLRAGEHRTWYSNGDATSYDIVNKNITIQAYPHEQAWFNGADVVDGWVSSGSGRWSRRWESPTFCDGKYYLFSPTEQPVSNTGPCSHYDMAKDPNYPVAGDPQMMFIDGVNQTQVGTLAGVTAGTFHYDWATRTMTTGTNPAGRTIELSARPVAMVLGGGKNYTIRGVGFHRYASNQYGNLTGATLYMGANKAVVENVVFSHNAGVGLALSTPRTGSAVRGSIFAYNGAVGLGANGSSKDGSRNDLMIENSIFNGNNFEFFGGGCKASCGAGNIKLTRMVGFTARNNIVENAFGTEGTGLWCDINCTDAVIVNNLVRNNGKHGIFYEISSRGLIASNLIVHNADRGMMVGSATTKVYNNTVITDGVRHPKAQGISVFDDSRWPGNPAETGPNTTGIELVNNAVSGQTGVLMIAHDGPGTSNTKAAQFFNAFDFNSYHHGGQKFISWATPDTNQGGAWFSDLTSFRQRTGWDQNATEVVGGADPFFVNFAGGDFRARAGSPIAGTGAPLPSDVAQAIGVRSGVPVDRGALTWPAAAW